MNDMSAASTAASSTDNALRPPMSDGPFRWLRTEVDRLFDHFGRSGAMLHFSEPLPTLALDMTENDDTYRITAELPGLKDEDVEVSLANRVLTISGEKRHDEERHEGGTLLSERRYGAFVRSVRLPEDADAAHVDARIKKGVLTVHIRKDENAASRVRRIEVKKD